MNHQESERFLVFSKRISTLSQVMLIDELLQIAEYDDRTTETHSKKLRRQLQLVEVAFKLQDNKIIAMDSCVLYLPTFRLKRKLTLRFFIQARYQTNSCLVTILKKPNRIHGTDGWWKKQLNFSLKSWKS